MGAGPSRPHTLAFFHSPCVISGFGIHLVIFGRRFAIFDLHLIENRRSRCCFATTYWVICLSGSCSLYIHMYIQICSGTGIGFISLFICDCHLVELDLLPFKCKFIVFSGSVLCVELGLSSLSLHSHFPFLLSYLTMMTLMRPKLISGEWCTYKEHNRWSHWTNSNICLRRYTLYIWFDLKKKKIQKKNTSTRDRLNKTKKK